VLTQKQRKAASAAAIDPTEAARLEREEIRAWLATRPGEKWDKDANERPAAELAAEAEARKAAGVMELTTRWNIGRNFPAAATGRKVPNPVAAWQEIERADISRLELADFAREAKRLEREAAKRRPDTFKVTAVKRSAQVLLADMPAAEVVAKSRTKRTAGDYAELAAVAADLGVEISELAEALETEKLLVAEQSRPLADVKSEVGYAAELTPAEVLERKARAADMLQSAEAVAGREVLAAIGPRASAVVTSKPDSFEITVSLVRTVPDLKAAEARIAGLSKPLAEAREALELAEKKAAAKTLNAEARKAAEAAADSKAAGVAKLAKRMAAAEAARDMALELAALPNAADLISVPLATLFYMSAAEAGALEIPDRTDRMPSSFVERGPRVRTSASWSGQTQHGGRGNGVTDPTGNSAAALVDGYRKAVAAAEAAEVKLAARVAADAIKAAAEVKKENNRSARKASEAARQKAGRASGKYFKKTKAA
jgi:hypothetical protein